MTEEFGVDLEQVFKVIDSAEVLIIRFHLIDKRLLVDFRVSQKSGPMIKVVPRAESVEDRVRSIKRMRPDFPMPDRILHFQWPRSMRVMLAAGVWERLVERLSSLGTDETTDACGRTMEELIMLERKEVMGAIRGADHYQTLWERQRA